MNADLNCLSFLELLELRDGQGDSEAREHLKGCLRCQALLSGIPSDFDAEPQPNRSSPSLTAGALSTAVSRPAARGIPVRTGALWRALATPDADFAWVVVIIGRVPGEDDQLLVAPVAGPPALATDLDLLVDPDALGYECFVDVPNFGTVLRTQLLEPVGHLRRPLAEGVVALYRHLLQGTPVPDDVPRGSSTVDEQDPRLLEQDARADRLLEFYRPALLLVDDEANHEDRVDKPQVGVYPGRPQIAPTPDTPSHGLAVLLSEQLDGPSAGWDRASLLEEAHADGAWLDRFLANCLDLTDKRDVPDLARILHTLDLPWEDTEPAVTFALQQSAGGARVADGPSVPMAARSRAGADPDATTRDLYADQSSVDASAQARKREITAYLVELCRELDELE